MNKQSIQISSSWLTVYTEVNHRIDATLNNEINITVTQFRILLELRAAGGRLPGVKFSRLLSLKPSSATCAIKNLEKAACITKQENRDDRRAIFVSITELGEAILDTAIQALNIMLMDFWHALTPDQIELILDSTRFISKKIESYTRLDDQKYVQPYYVTAIVVVYQAWVSSLRKSFDLSFTEYRILQLIKNNSKHLRGVDLAALLFINTSIVSIAISNLVNNELVLREKDPFDNRNYRVSLTNAGHEITAQASELISGINDTYYAGFNNGRDSLLTEISEIIYSSL